MTDQAIIIYDNQFKDNFMEIFEIGLAPKLIVRKTFKNFFMSTSHVRP